MKAALSVITITRIDRITALARGDEVIASACIDHIRNAVGNGDERALHIGSVNDVFIHTT